MTDTTRRRPGAFEVRVPASTSNLGAGFDCFGLALRLYLTVRATVLAEAGEVCRVRSCGEGSADLPRGAENLIYRAMRFAAEREGLSLPPVRLAVHSECPPGRGLGSSAAAIVAGLALCGAICARELSKETLLRYAFELEGHADNVAAALYGGLVVTCLTADGSVLALRTNWPQDLKVIAVSPNVSLPTSLSRAALPRTVTLEDAVYNLQRAALFVAALAGGAPDLLWEAMQDRLHQSHREAFVPGLSQALAARRQTGLVGLALSGSGPTVIALARERFEEIGETIEGAFRQGGTETTLRLLEVDGEGMNLKSLS